MNTQFSVSEHAGPVLAAIRATTMPVRSGMPRGPKPIPLPFVTISRQPGSGAWTLARELAAVLNSDGRPIERQWTSWDRELVEKVAAEHHLSTRLIESLEESDYSWLGSFLSSLKFSDDAETADDVKVYSRVASTLRALASAGRTILVGRGATFLTRSMPGGIHVRLVAPLETRVQLLMEHDHLTSSEARARIRDLDRSRQNFYRFYWPDKPITPETFTVVLNTGELTAAEMVAVLKPLLLQRETAAEASRVPRAMAMGAGTAR